VKTLFVSLFAIELLILPFNSKRSRLPNPELRNRMATPVGATGSKVRFDGYPTGRLPHTDARKHSALLLQQSSVLDHPNVTDACHTLDG
jgi:hypothetical protein